MCTPWPSHLYMAYRQDAQTFQHTVQVVSSFSLSCFFFWASVTRSDLCHALSHLPLPQRQSWVWELVYLFIYLVHRVQIRVGRVAENPNTKSDGSPSCQFKEKLLLVLENKGKENKRVQRKRSPRPGRVAERSDLFAQEKDSRLDSLLSGSRRDKAVTPAAKTLFIFTRCCLFTY